MAFKLFLGIPRVLSVSFRSSARSFSPINYLGRTPRSWPNED